MLVLTGCVIRDGRNYELTPGKLTGYAEHMLAINFVLPSYELATYLFIDEYRAEDEETRSELMKKYHTSEKIRQIDDETFHVPYLVEVNTGSRPFAETGWNTGWALSPDGRTWTNKDGVAIEPLYDDEGFLAELAVQFEGVVEERLDMKTSLSCPTGPFVLSNPLLVDDVDKLFYSFAYGNSLSDNGITCRGSFRVDIVTDTETIDWIVLTGTGSKTLISKTSQD